MCSCPRFLMAIFASLCALATAGAATIENLYDATVPVVQGNREAALVEALRTVAVRVSGRRDAAAQLGGALSNPRQYMRYESTAGGTLTAGFDSLSVDNLLSSAGLPIWGKERPSTLMWVQIEDASGYTRWITGDVPSAERDLIEKAAQQRGVPIVWPQGYQEPSASVLGDRAALLESAAQYGANAALLGRVRRAGAGYSAQWTLASGEGGADSAGSIEEGIHLAADTFARTYAASGSSLVNVNVEVSGLGSLDAYAQTLNYLEGLTLVQNVAVEEVAGDTMRFRLTVRGDAGTLRRAIALGDRLTVTTMDQGERLSFRYQP
jgi:hypothetical protein